MRSVFLMAPKWVKLLAVVSVRARPSRRMLACLGASRLASNLNQLAKATHVGNFYFDDDAKLSIKQASEDIAAIRQMLMLALGFEAESVQRSGSPKSRFNPASAPRLRP